MELDSRTKYKIVNDLIEKTVDNEIHWTLYSTISNVNTVYKYGIKLTETKNLLINLCVTTKNINDSYLTIYFSIKNYQNYVGSIKLIEQPQLHRLVIEVRKRSNLSESSMYNDKEDNRDDMMKNIKLITTLSKDTLEEKLEWRVTHKSDDAATFVADFVMTPYKKLTFCVICDQKSVVEEKNILRVILKVEEKKFPPSSSSSPIKKIPITKYPSLINLIRVLSKKYLNRGYLYAGFTKMLDVPAISLQYNDVTGLWEQPDDVEEGKLGYKPIPGEWVMYAPENLPTPLKGKIINRKAINKFITKDGLVAGDSYEFEPVGGGKMDIFVRQRMKTPFSKVKSEKTSPNAPFKEKGHKLVVPKDLGEYRAEVMNSIESSLREMPKDSTHMAKYLAVHELLNDLKYTNSYEEVNMLMFKCHKILSGTKTPPKRKPPVIGDRWG
jgi:hypothetical protein